ncbi:MAG: CPBP family intramembrane metalloprotease [Methanobacteriaceae archaeon]|nr:CPBP family intramembrane metalloprotease [Methanobacteriaceae archaeon]
MFSFLVGLIFVAIFGFGLFHLILAFTFPHFLAIPSMDYLFSSINNFIAFILLIALIKKIDLFKNIPWNIGGIKKGLLLGFTLIVFTILQMALIYSNALDKNIVFNLITMLNTVIYCISIGLWEETLCRGLLLTNMLKKWGNTKKGLVISIILSSVIFGGLHIISAFNAGLIPALIQVSYASIMGILLAIIYIKTKSLWSVIVLHIILNFSAYSMPYLVPGSIGNPPYFIIFLILFNVLWLVLSFFLIVKMDVEDINNLLYFNQEHEHQ